MQTPNVNFREYPAGTVIFKEGDPGHEMFVIQAGVVKITRNVNGKEVRLATLRDSQFFGEMAIIDSYPRSASAMTLADTKVLVFSQEYVEKLLDEIPNWLMSITRAVISRLRFSNDRLMENWDGLRNGDNRLPLEEMMQDIVPRKFSIIRTIELLVKEKENALFNRELFINEVKQITYASYDTIEEVLGEAADAGLITFAELEIRILDRYALLEWLQEKNKAYQ